MTIMQSHVSGDGSTCIISMCLRYSPAALCAADHWITCTSVHSSGQECSCRFMLAGPCFVERPVAADTKMLARPACLTCGSPPCVALLLA